MKNGSAACKRLSKASGAIKTPARLSKRTKFFTDRNQGLLLAALVALLWGVLGFGLREAFRFSDPATVSWFRFTFSFLSLSLIIFIRQPESLPHTRRIPWWMILAALGLALNYLGYAKGVQFTTPGNAQMLSQLGPLLAVVGGIFILHERLSPRQWAGVLVALTGFALFYLDQLQFFVASREEYKRGNLWILVGSVSWATWALMQKRATRLGHTPRLLNFFVYGWSAVFLFSFAQLTTLQGLGLWPWVLLLLLAINTLVAYGALALALEKAPSSLVNLIIACNPLVSLAIDHDQVAWTGWVGAGFVLTGVVFTLKRT
ncbi:MAG: DMT family transporter [Bdellovibrio sp.]